MDGRVDPARCPDCRGTCMDWPDVCLRCARAAELEFQDWLAARAQRQAIISVKGTQYGTYFFSSVEIDSLDRASATDTRGRGGGHRRDRQAAA